MALISDYLKDDCVYLGQMVIDFIETYGMNITQASAAMKFWAKLSDIKRLKSSKYYYEGNVKVLLWWPCRVFLYWRS